MRFRAERRPLVVGHRGAAAVAPANTLASLEAAVDAGSDVVEFDVVRGLDGSLVLAHSRRETAAESLTLDDALAWFAERPCGVHVDVKGHGYEEQVVAALDRHGLASRSLVSSVGAASLRRFAWLAPDLPRAIAYPDDRFGIARKPVSKPFVAGGLVALRQTIAARVGRMIERAEATAVSLHHGLLTPRTIERCHARGVPVIAWTVNDPGRARALAALGVDAVVSDDPGMLAATLFP
jgi:glycerophosphoryl diester phosphodiesterase